MRLVPISCSYFSLALGRFNRGSIAGAFNILPSESPDADALIRDYRGNTMIVIGSKGPTASQVSIKHNTMLLVN